MPECVKQNRTKRSDKYTEWAYPYEKVEKIKLQDISKLIVSLSLTRLIRTL